MQWLKRARLLLPILILSLSICAIFFASDFSRETFSGSHPDLASETLAPYEVIATDEEVTLYAEEGFRNVAAGDHFYPGQTIATGGAGRVVLGLGTRAKITLGPNSNLSYIPARPGDSRLVTYLENGTAHFSVWRPPSNQPDGPSIVLETPNVSCVSDTAGLTEFFVSVEDEG